MTVNLVHAFVIPSYVTFVYAATSVAISFIKWWIYSHDYTSNDYITFYLITSSVFAILVVLVELKTKLNIKDLENGKTEKDINERDIIIGSKAVEYILRTPMIIFPLLGPKSLISIYIYYVALMSGALILAIFILPKVRMCRLLYAAEYENIFGCVLFLHAFSICFAAFITFLMLRSSDDNFLTLMSQIPLALISSPVITIKLFVEQYGFELLDEVEAREKSKKEKEEKERLEDMMPDPSGDQADNIGLKETECKVCYQQFSTKQAKRTPRIFKECGHTVCGGCASNLLNANNWVYINCPFCQEPTFVDGSARKLPKNFTVIAILEELKKLK